MASFEVESPFDASARHADIILRSSDGHDFRVLKHILAVASPVFSDMMALGEPLSRSTSMSGPSDELTVDGLPVISLQEDALTLDTLLRLIYPVCKPIACSHIGLLDLLASTMRAARKYDMGSAVGALRGTMFSFLKDADQDALPIFMFSHELGMKELTNMAAMKFLECPPEFSELPALQNMPAEALFKLFAFKHRVANKIDSELFAPITCCRLTTAQQAIIRLVECPMRRPLKSITEGCGANESGHNVSAWWMALRNEVRRGLERAPLSKETFSAEAVARAASTKDCCEACVKHVLQNLEEITDAVRTQMRIISFGVKLELSDI